MYLRQRLLVALALSRHVFASLHAAVPAQAVRRVPAPDPTLSPHLHNRGDLEERQAQVILMGCPEMFNEPVHSCDSCGGESKTTPGKCSDPNGSGFFCKCSNTGPNGKTTTHITATAGSATAVGTYELDTMTEYGSLRQHITVTTTATASNTATGDSGLETVAVVVLAGGVAWFLADASGSAAAISQLEPPAEAEDHDDDKTCPDPKDKCSDCGGKLQMCTTGTDSGCACEEDDDGCPADGSTDQPNCSDDSCNGQDGKCTAGDHKGCDCKKAECPADGSDDQPDCSDDDCKAQDGKCTAGEYKDCDCKQTECPDLKEYPFFFCSDCGGDDGTGKCKGDPDEDPPNLWKSCECNAEPDWNSWPDEKLTRTNVAQHQAVLNSLPDITAAQPSSSSAPLPKPSCDSNDVSNIPYNVFDPGVYTKFCNTLNGGDKTKALKQTVDSSGNVISGSKRKRTPPPNPSAYKDYKFFLSWSGGDGSCPSGCTSVFSTITDNICGHVGGEQNVMTNEAKLDTGCGIYSYSISAPPSATSTPAPTQPTEVPGVPTVGAIQCANYDKDAYKGCWNDIHKDSVKSCRDAMANQLPGRNVTSASPNITQVLREGASGGQGGHGVVYMMNIGWIPGCNDYPTQAPDNPRGHSGDSTISYGTLLMNTYNSCNNNGLGGFVDVGCVRYGFYPNDISGVFASPPHPELFWKQYPNICG